MLSRPVLLYNERCSICYRLARVAYRATRGRIAIMGMYSEKSFKYRSLILNNLTDRDLYDSMPWLITGKRIYGGIYVIKPILIESLKAIFKPGNFVFTDDKPIMCEPRVEGNGLFASLKRSLLILRSLIIQLYESVLSKRFVIEI